MKLAIFHATANAISPVMEALSRLATEATALQYMDEGLLASADHGEQAFERLLSWVRFARDDGADALLLTCSTFSPLVPNLSKAASLPIVSIDDAMLETALETGPRIHVFATLATAARATESQLKALAGQRKRELQIAANLIPDAFQMLKDGRAEEHDNAICAAVESTELDCDAIVLAQASMSRAARAVHVSGIPVLSSPDLAIQQLLATATKKPATSRA